MSPLGGFLHVSVGLNVVLVTRRFSYAGIEYTERDGFVCRPNGKRKQSAIISGSYDSPAFIIESEAFVCTWGDAIHVPFQLLPLVQKLPKDLVCVVASFWDWDDVPTYVFKPVN